eukprot:UN09430
MNKNHIFQKSALNSLPHHRIFPRHYNRAMFLPNNYLMKL